MNFLSAVGYTLFPLSGSGFQGKFADIMHLYVITFGVVILSILSLVLIIIGGFRSKGNKAIASLALVALASMFFGSMGMNVISKNYFGLLERFSVYSVVVYTAVLGVFGFLTDKGKA
jgi:hypothetical protein